MFASRPSACGKVSSTLLEDFQIILWLKSWRSWINSLYTQFQHRYGYVTGLLLLCGDMASHPGPALNRRPAVSHLKWLLLNARSLKRYTRNLDVLLACCLNTQTCSKNFAFWSHDTPVYCFSRRTHLSVL